MTARASLTARVLDPAARVLELSGYLYDLAGYDRCWLVVELAPDAADAVLCITDATGAESSHDDELPLDPDEAAAIVADVLPLLLAEARRVLEAPVGRARAARRTVRQRECDAEAAWIARGIARGALLAEAAEVSRG